MSQKVNLTELRALHAAATPGEMTYGRRADGSVWYSIGDPKNGPHIQGDIEMDEKTLDLTAALHNAFPEMADLIDAFRAAMRQAVVNSGGIVESDIRDETLLAWGPKEMAALKERVKELEGAMHKIADASCMAGLDSGDSYIHGLATEALK